jgi:hypothetical protein
MEDAMTDDTRETTTRRDAEYAERISEHDHSAIGDTPSGTGTLKSTDDIGTGGTADVAGRGDFGGTESIRTGNIARGGVLGSALGDVGPKTGATGMSESENQGFDALAHERSGPDLSEAAPLDRGVLDRAEARVDTSEGGGLNQAAVHAAGLPRTGQEELPGTADLGAAGGADLGSGLGKTRGMGADEPRGEITAIGGTRGSGAGTGHREGTEP